MKKFFLTLTALVVGFTMSAQRDASFSSNYDADPESISDTRIRRTPNFLLESFHEVKTNPLAFALGTSTISYETPLSLKGRVTLNATITFQGQGLDLPFVDSASNLEYSQYGLAVLGLRKYLGYKYNAKNGNESMTFIGVTSRNYYAYASEENFLNSNVGSFGFFLGKKHFLNDGFTVEYFAGLGRSTYGDLSLDLGLPINKTIDPILGFNFGYRL